MTAIQKTRAHLVERAIEALSRGRPPADLEAPSPGSTPGSAAGAAEAVPPEDAGRLAGTAPPASDLPPDTPPRQPAAVPDIAVADPARNPSPKAAPRIAMPALVAAGLVVSPSGPARSRLTEEITLLQNQILRTMRLTQAEEGRCPRIVLITSARPEEGKSFSSLNLAAGMAIASAREVVLVDADGKPGSLSELMGCGQEPGLRHLAVEPERDPAALLLPTGIQRLSVMSYGPAVPGGPAVPASATVSAALLRLAAALPDRVLILDSPPCLSTSDPSALASIAGQVLMVVAAETTQRSEVEAALDMVDACPTIQLMLNRARLTGKDSFGAYGYGYGYGYGGYGAPPAG